MTKVSSQEAVGDLARIEHRFVAVGEVEVLGHGAPVWPEGRSPRLLAIRWRALAPAHAQVMHTCQQWMNGRPKRWQARFEPSTPPGSTSVGAASSKVRPVAGSAR